MSTSGAKGLEFNQRGTPSKQVEINPNKNLWIPWFYSSESGLFSGLREKINKIDSRLKLCARRLKRMSSLFPVLAARRVSRFRIMRNGIEIGILNFATHIDSDGSPMRAGPSRHGRFDANA
jgi:hypothetical protein